MSVLRSVVALLLCATATLGQDTFAPLKDGKSPKSFEELWADFDPRHEPLDVEVLRQWEEDDVVMRVLRYRVGAFKGKKAMVAAVFGYPKGAKSLPGLVQIHGGGQYADYRAVLTNARRGYATISIAWAGRINAPEYKVTPAEVKLFWDGATNDPNYKLTTDWGALDGYHAPSRNLKNAFPKIPEPAEWTLDPVKSPRNNGWFLCTLAARRALTFLERQPQVDPDRLGVYGHSMGGKLTVLVAGSDDRVKAAAPSCGGVSDRYNDDPLFRATIGDDQYLRRVACPIVFLSPANDFHGRINDLQTALGEIQTGEWRITCSPHQNHQDTAEYEVATQLWFDQYLKNSFRWPETPKTKLDLRAASRVPVITVQPDSSMPIAAVKVYYTQDADPTTDRDGVINRFWHHAHAEKHGDTWAAQLPLSTVEQPLWAYANVAYALEKPVTGAGYYYGTYTTDQFNLSSPMTIVAPSELQTAKIEATLKPSTVIETFKDDWEKQWFTYRPEEWGRRTHKVNDPSWAAPEGAKLSVEVRSQEANKLVAGIDAYAAEVQLNGGTAWQTITLAPSEFRDARGDELKSFDGIKELRLLDQETLRARQPDATRKVGTRWKGAAPEFRKLKWITRKTELSPALPLMPKNEDTTAMWWAKGFPDVIKSAPWLRVIQTGYFAFALNTETLKVPQFGVLSKGAAWDSLPSGELVLTIHVDGKTYRCTGAKPWTRYTGPRLIESGRFFQRGDITDLIFESQSGETLEIDARLETVAWPDRLSFILVADGKLDGANMEIAFTSGGKTLRHEASGREVALAIDPMNFRELDPNSPVGVDAGDRPVVYEPSLGWHRINLDGIVPNRADSNDAMERIPLILANPTDREQVARLMFEKTRRGIRQKIGAPITGISAVLRDADGQPIGIPVQLSKNWHTKPEGGTYAEQWFHGITQLRLPPGSKQAVELVIVYGHWGGVPAASHSQLSLIGWSGNQLWEESALGSWGESICYDAQQALADCTITDVRPLMVTPMNGNGKWSWTHNVGGGDFFRLFDEEGERIPHGAMRATYHRYGPCLTEVTYSGVIGENIRHSETLSLGRTDDIVRGIYRIRLDVDQAQPFSRFAIFQVGADTYNFTREPKFALGDADGLINEWSTTPGGNVYRTEPFEANGENSWISMHEARRRSETKEAGAWANRGIVIREWNARLGGKTVPPHFSERGTTRHGSDYSTIDLVPPPGLTRLEPGDFIEATLEHVIIPQSASDYYGPNESLRSALQTGGNTWRMVHREATGNRREVSVGEGELVHRFPDIRVHSDGDQAALKITGGLGYVPITITGLTSYTGYTLTVDGKPLDQSIHGNDFWQTDYDAATRRWSRTYNVKLSGNDAHQIQFSKKQ